jgi:hypothetical protein
MSSEGGEGWDGDVMLEVEKGFSRGEEKLWRCKCKFLGCRAQFERRTEDGG